MPCAVSAPLRPCLIMHDKTAYHPRSICASAGVSNVRIMRACRLRNACKDNVSCLTGKGNKRAAPQFREFMEPVITEMDPEECVEEQYKV